MKCQPAQDLSCKISLVTDRCAKRLQIGIENGVISTSPDVIRESQSLSQRQMIGAIEISGRSTELSDP